jgi:hypothetical protein
MTLRELLADLGQAQWILFAIATAAPLLLFGFGRLVSRPIESRAFGWAASGSISIGLVGMALAAVSGYLMSGEGSLLDAPLAPLLIPFWFGFGSLWVGTHFVPWDTLKTYPMLNRVWAVLSLALLIVVVFAVLQHTFLLVFTGIMGFVGLALVAFVLWHVLWGGVVGDSVVGDSVVGDKARKASDAGNES